MAHKSDLIVADIDRYLAVHERKSLLRFITCGSVDDGKSTLIGRLLFESKMIFEDQLAALAADSKRLGTTGGDLDFALLLDGLAAEREQGITIDVAYRFFSTEKRKFIVADTPGHEQYTRNMATGASTAALAVILVDARKGVLVQTRRHSIIVSLLGLKHVVLAVNKMDLVGWSKDRFDALVAEYREFAARLGFDSIEPIPLSALKGDNVVEPSAATPWYRGPALMTHLETVEIEERLQHHPFRLPVQWVNRPDADFRGFTGRIASGVALPGDRVRVLPSGRESRIARIVSIEGDLSVAVAGQSVTLTLADEVDVSRGDVLAAADAAPEVASRFLATVVWMHEVPLETGQSMLFKIGTRTVAGTIAGIRARVDVNTHGRHAASALGLNEVGDCEVTLIAPIAFDPYDDNRDTGGFIVIDRVTNDTIAAGMIRSSIGSDATQGAAAARGAKEAPPVRAPFVIWFTGLPCAGKTTIATKLEARFAELGRPAYLLDGDVLRRGLSKDLGFSAADRAENVRRTAEVARILGEAGVIAIVALISPFRAERRVARERIGAGSFVEIFVDTPLAEAERRDPKGLYAKARRGEIRDFTGIDSPYEVPENPDIRIKTLTLSPDAAVARILDALAGAGHLRAG